VQRRKTKSKGEFPCTDAGNAEFISELFGNVLRYDHKQGRWLIWHRTRRQWHEDRCCEIRKFAIAAARRRRKGAARLADSTKSKPEIRWSFESEHRNRVDAALELAKGFPPISETGEEWDADPWLLGVKNGVVNLRTGKLRKERPKHRITKHSPVRFVPDAQCPRFERFLDEVFCGDASLIDYIHRVMGYCLCGSVQEQCIFCWYGCGANGKSTLALVLDYICGDYCVNLPFSALEMTNRNSHDLVALAGARLATASETNEGVRLNEARIKVLTGGDPITARRLYREPFTFDPSHKLVLAFNHKPIIADDSEGMWRRVHLTPFMRQFAREEQDKGLIDKLKAEAPGILALAVRACLRYQKEGLNPPPAVRNATAEYHAESDHLGEFIQACIVEDPEGSVSSSCLWQEYDSWAKENEEVMLSRSVFAAKMQRRGYRRGRSGHGGTRVWQGIRTTADMVTDADRHFGKFFHERSI
jgi:putative DNA primase/helicase